MDKLDCSEVPNAKSAMLGFLMSSMILLAITFCLTVIAGVGLASGSFDPSVVKFLFENGSPVFVGIFGGLAADSAYKFAKVVNYKHKLLFASACALYALVFGYLLREPFLRSMGY